jgi:D-arabinono-1,4-lactone oxidase
VVGAGHSWSPLGLTDGFLVSLDHYNQVLHVDKARRRVTVQAGIRVRDLSRR